MMDRLIARVFATRDSTQLAHWAAKGHGSYAKHVALGELYDGIIDKLDEIVEVYQGSGKGLVSVAFQSPRVSPEAIVDHIRNEADWIAKSREEIAAGIPSVLNLVDELHATYCRALYKLTYLQ